MRLSNEHAFLLLKKNLISQFLCYACYLRLNGYFVNLTLASSFYSSFIVVFLLIKTSYHFKFSWLTDLGCRFIPCLSFVTSFFACTNPCMHLLRSQTKVKLESVTMLPPPLSWILCFCTRLPPKSVELVPFIWLAICFSFTYIYMSISLRGTKKWGAHFGDFQNFWKWLLFLCCPYYFLFFTHKRPFANDLLQILRTLWYELE